MQAELQRQGKNSAQLDAARYKVQGILSEFERRFTDFASTWTTVADLNRLETFKVDLDLKKGWAPLT